MTNKSEPNPSKPAAVPERTASTATTVVVEQPGEATPTSTEEELLPTQSVAEEENVTLGGRQAAFWEGHTITSTH